MPEEVKKMVEERMKETEKDKGPDESSDLYLDDFKKNFGAKLESRNTGMKAFKLSKDN